MLCVLARPEVYLLLKEYPFLQLVCYSFYLCLTQLFSLMESSFAGNARALQDEGRPRSVSPLPPSTPNTSILNGDSSFDLNMPSGSTIPGTPGSINGYKRMSLGGSGGTSKVLSDLQTAALHARNALDNTRQQLRLSQRSVASVRKPGESHLADTQTDSIDDS